MENLSCIAEFEKEFNLALNQICLQTQSEIVIRARYEERSSLFQDELQENWNL